MELAFWILVGLLAHTYLLYPLSLPFLGLIGRSRQIGDPSDFKVTIIIAAYNEEEVIEEKIKNCFELEFPPENLEILIGSDGSSDRTDEIVSRYKDRVRLISLPRGGKSSVLNHIIPEAKGDFLVFCDANTMLLKNALHKLLAPFADDKVGCVCGRLVLQDSGISSLSMGETVYWNLESEIKKMEGRLGIVIGANGGIYALRKHLFRPIPVSRTVMDDFYITTQCLRQGKEAIYEPQAIGSEETSRGEFGEFHRKVRIGQANFNYLFHYLGLLSPHRPVLAYGFFSHKLLRWVAPLLLLVLFLLNMMLLRQTTTYLYLGIAQALFYTLALMGATPGFRRQGSGIVMVPYYFVSMNVALLLGMLKSLNPASSGGAWSRVERGPSTADSPSGAGKV